MSIYIENDLECRLKALEMENFLLRKYNDYHQVIHQTDHMSDPHSSAVSSSLLAALAFVYNWPFDFGGNL